MIGNTHVWCPKIGDFKTEALYRGLEVAGSYTIETYVRHLKTEGWCQVMDVIPKDRIEAIREEVVTGHQRSIDGYEAWSGSRAQEMGPNGEPRTCHVAYIPSLAAYFAEQRVLGIAQAILDPHVRIAQTEFKTRPPNDQNSDWRGYHSDFPHDLTDRDAGAIRMPFPDVTMGLTVTLDAGRNRHIGWTITDR